MIAPCQVLSSLVRHHWIRTLSSGDSIVLAQSQHSIVNRIRILQFPKKWCLNLSKLFFTGSPYAMGLRCCSYIYNRPVRISGVQAMTFDREISLSAYRLRVTRVFYTLTLQSALEPRTCSDWNKQQSVVCRAPLWDTEQIRFMLQSFAIRSCMPSCADNWFSARYGSRSSSIQLILFASAPACPSAYVRIDSSANTSLWYWFISRILNVGDIEWPRSLAPSNIYMNIHYRLISERSTYCWLQAVASFPFKQFDSFCDYCKINCQQTLASSPELA